MKIHARHGFTGSILALGMLALTACAAESSDSATPDLDPSDTALTEPVDSTAQPLCDAYSNYGIIRGTVRGAGGVPLNKVFIDGYSNNGWWESTQSYKDGTFALVPRAGVWTFKVDAVGYPVKYYYNVVVDCNTNLNVTVQL